jgi:hypothetical protein
LSKTGITQPPRFGTEHTVEAGFGHGGFPNPAYDGPIVYTLNNPFGEEPQKPVDFITAQFDRLGQRTKNLKHRFDDWIDNTLIDRGQYSLAGLNQPTAVSPILYDANL